ncbi:hypothetical protein B0I33_104503 [Prauserella shujinwangii]|uniref:HK97 gp10 family phage protein n=1 Tax=Prauserella shujinwangii TaxID=1453103 RepID=A0A2T0LXD8_9PSEU|nr:hypothetical protein [Prauserella shujinwangii]PRX48685.1 hypothetical protein B0I33_104503 [Prauserella shujinwangii]
MAAKQGLTVNLYISGLRPTLAAFRELPKDANNELRDRSRELAETLAGRIRTAAQAEGGQAALLARTVKAQRDRVPVVSAGGTRKLGRHRAPAWALLFAAEFGMNKRSGWYARPRYRGSSGRQYPPHSGQDGYWFFPTAREFEPEMGRQWRQAADAIIRRFAGVA